MASIQQHIWDNVTVYTLENDSFTASLIPELGSNVSRLFDRVAQRDVLRTPDHPDTLRNHSVHYGIPLLLPPCRTKHAQFPFNGRMYTLEKNTPEGHHIHGFLRNRPWEVVHTEADAIGQRASVTTRFRTAQFPELAEQYPHDLTVDVVTVLDGDALLQTFSFHNASSEPAPFGFGLHTWFLLDQTPDQWTLHLPSEDIWELDPDLVPTGKQLPLGKFAALRDGMPLQGVDIDMVLRIGDRPAEATLSRPGYTMRYSASAPFTQWVVYTRGEVSDTICIEPLTWTPNAPNVDADASLTGMRAIAAGETLRMQVNLHVDRT